MFMIPTSYSFFEGKEIHIYRCRLYRKNWIHLEYKLKICMLLCCASFRVRVRVKHKENTGNTAACAKEKPMRLQR